MTEITPRARADFEGLRERHPDATLTDLSGGAALIGLNFKIPEGWSASLVKLWFVAPNGYSVAAPDCFWVEPNLTVNGALPVSSAYENAIPGTSIKAHWFSWHVENGAWSPNDGNFLVWLSLCTKRFLSLK